MRLRAPKVVVMDADETATAVAELFADIYGYFHRRRDPREYQPSGESLAFLHHLAASGPLTIAEACSHFDRSQAAISERIERLIRRGLVERIADERDRRRHLVWLTDAGDEIRRRESHVLSMDRLRRAACRMTAAERGALVSGMHQLIAAAAGDRVQRKDRDANGQE